jgi:hypothetical protein
MQTSSRIVRIAAVSAVGALGALLPLGAAGAYPNPQPPEVAPIDTGRTQTSVEANRATAEANPATVEANRANVAANRAARASTLPFTGTDVAELVAIGGASVGVGMVLVRRSRRARTIT